MNNPRRKKPLTSLNPKPPAFQLSLKARRQVLFGCLLVAATLLLWRAGYLQITHHSFLQQQGEARHLRTLTLPAYRGRLLDRHGEPLAISTPVDSVWAEPRLLHQAATSDTTEWKALLNILKLPVNDLKTRLAKRQHSDFFYLKRHVSPPVAEQVMGLHMQGVHLQREYRRYYPNGAVFAPLLGFTDIDDQGQEGLELALEKFLAGTEGSKRVIRDQQGRVLADVAHLQMPRMGEDITLSIDKRLQYVTHRELHQTMRRHLAVAAAAVILDVQTGEVLAMVSLPASNPNNRKRRDGGRYRNRAATDVFEPGSTMKPLTIAAALESGLFQPHSMVNTSPGILKLGGYTVRDSRNYGTINLTTVIQKSSNVGVSKIALTLPPRDLWDFFLQLGFDLNTRSGFPGEANGQLRHYADWQRADQGSIGFGYGLNVTLLQLARAYAVLGNGGELLPLSLTKRQQIPEAQRVLSKANADHVVRMLESVIAADGTGEAAAVQGFRVAGKTGTVRKHIGTGYARQAHLSLFAGLIPASQPRLAMAVLVDQPQGDYYGGEVAAPVFGRVMREVVRLLNIAPDGL